jgi:hypothetical protein
MATPDRIEQLAAKKAATAKENRARTDRYTRSRLGQSRDIVAPKRVGEDFPVKPDYKGSEGMGNKYDVLAGRVDNVDYRKSDVSKPSASVQAMLKKKKK